MIVAKDQNRDYILREKEGTIRHKKHVIFVILPTKVQE